MFVRLDPVLGTFRILLWQWKAALFFTVSAVVIVGVHQYWLPLLELPAFPLAVVGGAIGIFVSFRSNAGYDRWWAFSARCTAVSVMRRPKQLGQKPRLLQLKPTRRSWPQAKRARRKKPCSSLVAKRWDLLNRS